MLRPGTRIKYDGAEGTVERTVGPGEVIVRTAKGKFVAHERFLTILGSGTAVPIVTPEAPPANPASTGSKVEGPPDFTKMSHEELLAECAKRGWEVEAGASDQDIIDALKSE